MAKRRKLRSYSLVWGCPFATYPYNWRWTSWICSYTAAAEILSESTESFETIVLKFLSKDGERRGGLKLLLENKLVKCNSSSPEVILKTHRQGLSMSFRAHISLSQKLAKKNHVVNPLMYQLFMGTFWLRIPSIPYNFSSWLKICLDFFENNK